MICIDIDTIVQEAVEAVGRFDELEEFSRLIESADTYYTETVQYAAAKKRTNPNFIMKVIYTFRAFVQTVIEGLRYVWKNFRTEMKRASTKKATISKLKAMRKDAVRKRELGKTAVMMPNVEVIAGVYTTEVDSHWKNVERMMKKTYVDINQMQKDYEEIVDGLEFSKSKIIRATAERIEVPIDTAIEMIEDELSGKSICYKVIDDAIYKLNRMNDYVKHMAKDIEINEDNNILPKRLNYVQRIIRSITMFLASVDRAMFTVIFSLI